jgi:hypothetical protein
MWTSCYKAVVPSYHYSTIKEFLESASGLTDKPSSIEDPWEGSGTSTASGESAATQPTESSSKTNPEHYRRGKIEPWDFIESQGLDFFLGNAVKYITRAGHKPGESAKDDLEKAIVYLNKKLASL